jgi:hypothetical protein
MSGAFLIGLLLGLAIGATVLTMLSFVIIGALTLKFLAHAPFNVAVLTFLGDIPALALGWWGVAQTRKATNFFSGALIGLGAGMLGGVTLGSLFLHRLSS